MSTIKPCCDKAVGSQIITSRNTKSMVCVWLAVLLLVVGWLGITPIYSSPHWSAIFIFVIALALFTISLRQTAVSSLPREYLGLLLPLGFLVYVVPWPYNIGAVLIIISLVVITIGERSMLLRRVALAMGLSGVLMLLESALQPLFFRIFAHCHGSPLAARLIQLILRSLGIGVSRSGSVIYQQTFDALLPINITSEALALYFLLSFIILGSALLIMLRSNCKCWLIFLAVTIIYLFVRYPLLLLMYEETKTIEMFWSTWITLLTFAPLCILVGVLTTQGLELPKNISLPRFEFGLSSAKILFLSSIATICFVALLSFQDPGIPKQGRVLIDEAHSSWEITTRKYDTTWYNEASGYNYYSMADYLNHFYQVSRGNERITPELLSHYDILILKTLTKPLEQEEIDAVVDFVRGGGGLWLIGDHTNVFGISTRMNPLAQRFGISFRFDSTYDLMTGGLSVYRPSTMLPHPTVQHMPPVFLFGTSCSMSSSYLSECPVIGYSLLARRADYSRQNFFPERKGTLDQEFGLFPQAITIRFGQGRVAAWTDSTVFSNFWFFMPGKSELCLGTVNWLNKRNGWVSVCWIFAIGTILVSWCTVRLRAKTKPVGFLIWMLTGALIGVPTGILALAALNRIAYPLPVARLQLHRIAFEREHCNFTLTDESMPFSRNMTNHYHTFFVWTQRLGYIPASRPSLSSSVNQAEILVLLNPNKRFSTKDTLKIDKFLREGGKVLVLDGTRNKDSTANQFLMGYGIRIEEMPFRQSWIRDRNNNKIAVVDYPRTIAGGKPVLIMENGKSFASTVMVGKGLIVVVGSSHLFADSSMGNTSAVPSTIQSGIYDIEFWLMRNLMEGSINPTLWNTQTSQLDMRQ